MRNDGREINFQEFLNSLLVDGRVDHLQVINQRIVRVFLKESAGAGIYVSAIHGCTCICMHIFPAYIMNIFDACIGFIFVYICK